MKVTLKNVKRNFENWRTHKARRGERIPVELLEEASVCAFKYGFTETRQALKLDVSRLKKAMEEYPQCDKPAVCEQKKTDPMEFLEAKFLDMGGEDRDFFAKREEGKFLNKVLYELEAPHGTKLKIFSWGPEFEKMIFSIFSSGG